MGHSEASKRSRFPGCPLRGFQPSGSYPRATDNLRLWFYTCPKCSKSRDLTAIAICDSNRESQITSDLKHCEPSQKSSLFWLLVQENGIAILTAMWTEAQITNRAIWNPSRKCAINTFWTKPSAGLLRWGSRGSRQIIYVRIFPIFEVFSGDSWLKVRFEPPETAIWGNYLRFGLRDYKSLAICDLQGGPVRFGSVAVWGWNGSNGSGFRFRRFLCKKGFSVFRYSIAGKDGSGSGFGSWNTVPAVPVPLSVSGKTVPTVPVSGSGPVPEPYWICDLEHLAHVNAPLRAIASELLRLPLNTPCLCLSVQDCASLRLRLAIAKPLAASDCACGCLVLSVRDCRSMRMYKYIYIYICCRVKNWSNFCLF